MTEYKIWFQPKEYGTGQYLPGPTYVYHHRAHAQRAADAFNTIKNPAWNGVFSVVEFIDGKLSGK